MNLYDLMIEHNILGICGVDIGAINQTDSRVAKL